MKAIGLVSTAAIRERFSLFVSTADAYGFLRHEALTADVQPSEPCVIFDLATVPVPWFQDNVACRKLCVLRNRRDVEVFISLQAKLASVPFGLSDLVLVWDQVALNGNERAALRAAQAEFFSDIDAVLAEGGALDCWLERPRRLFVPDHVLATNFHILRYRSSEPLSIFQKLVSGGFVFEEDIGISATTMVADAPASLGDAEAFAVFDEAFVFLGLGVSTLETISIFRSATGRNPMVSDQVAYSVEGISKTLIRLRLA